MRIFMMVLATLSLAACAKPTGAPPPQVRAHNPCTGGFIALYFEEGSAALSPQMANRLDWPFRAKAQCETLTLTVLGLPDPSGDSLQANRARSVQKLLQAFDLPEPSFELGEETDQAKPGLEIKAWPKS